MQLQELPIGLPMGVRQWAEALRELAVATGEPTAAALASKLHCSPAALSRYLRGERPARALTLIVPRMVQLANEHDQRTWTIEELKPLYEQATQTSVPTAPGTEAAPTKATPDAEDALVDKPPTEPVGHDHEPAAVAQTATSAPDAMDQPIEHPQVSGPEAADTSMGNPAPKHRGRKVVPVLVGLAVLVLFGAGAYWLWGVPGSGQANPPIASSDTPAAPGSTATDRSTTADPAPQRRCALVAVATSPVWVNLDDPEPLKWKAKDERVRLLDLPPKTTPNGTFQAVHVPRGGRTGQGWMPAGDLKPTSCAGLP